MMPNSLSQKTQLTCPQTNQPFAFEVWLIIDRDERPDLIEKAKNGTLHTVTSPYTGVELGGVDAPLLIFQPNHTPPLFFSPAQQTTSEQDQQQAMGLLQQLQQSLGTNWQDSWLQDGLSAVPRALISEALEDFERAIGKLQQAMQNQRQPGINPADEINAIIQQLQQPPRDRRDMPRRVELCRRALELLPKQGNEQLWAALQVALGNALNQNPLGDRAENIEQAIAAYQQALTVMTQTAMPVDWATTMMNLANAYYSRIRGDRAENIEQAIAAYQQALTVRTQTAMPVEWATTMMNLANAYSDRIRGDRAENIEQAIAAYQQALTVMTQTAMPVEWAQTLNNLATAYSDRIRGDRAENIEQAIAAYQQALTVMTQTAMPVEWAQTLNNLANAYRNRIRGDRAENIEQAIAAYQQALTVMTQTAMPVEWATTMMNLANAYSDRIRGDRAENIEQAIAAYQQALTVRTQTAMPVEWATTMMNLATAYRNRIRGDRAENIEQAIAACQDALTVRTQTAMPVEWATTMMNLATAYYSRIRGDRAENIEQAIAAYQQALTVRTQTAMPVEWAQTLNNLANAYYSRIRGDRAENIEQAIAAYQQALTVRTQTAMPVDWATTMMNLANAYRNRIRGDRAENIEQAIAAYQQAITVMTQTAMPVEWATTMMNLATAYRNRIRGDRAENIEQAIAAYQQALTVRTQTAMPVEWATTMMNLATAYYSRIRGDRAENIEQAIAAYQQALTVMTQTAMPVDWATTMMNLATAYSDRIRGDRAENIEQAIAAYQQALTVMTQTAMPVEHRDTLRNLVILHFGERRWAEAYQTCLAAITVGVDIFAVAVGDAGRMDAIRQTGDLYTRAAYSAAQLGRYGEALTQLEAGKARLLAEAQSLGDANLTQLDDTERGRLQALRDKIRALEYEARQSIENPARRQDLTISADLREARAALRGLIDTFRIKYPDFMPQGLALADLLANIPIDGALVAPLFTDQGSAVFIVPGGVDTVTADHVLMLEDFKLTDLHELTRGPADDPVWGGWLGAYFTFRRNRDAKTLFDGIDDVTRRLWDAFVGRVHERLQTIGVQRVLLMPQGDTNLLPLHAAWREVDGARRYFMDDFAISYTPSMSTLATAKRKTTPGAGALVIGVSEYGTMNDLPNTRAEAEGIAALFGISALLDGAATVEAVRAGVTGKAYVHLSCHGGFGWGGNAFASALYLGNDEALPLPQIIANLDLDAARLVVLSACETGIVDFRNVPDEFVGLPAGFMQAGASAVVSSLWSVEDRSTALLMERMYNNLRGDNPMQPAQALREAQFWLRDATAGEIGNYYQSHLVPRMSQSEAGQAFVEVMMRAAPHQKPYEHPFYWAAFAYSGV